METLKREQMELRFEEIREGSIEGKVQNAVIKGFDRYDNNLYGNLRFQLIIEKTI